MSYGLSYLAAAIAYTHQYAFSWRVIHLLTFTTKTDNNENI